MISVIAFRGFSKKLCMQQVLSTEDFEFVEVKGESRAEAYNKSINYVQGDYVMFLDEKEWVDEKVLTEIGKGLLDEDFLISNFVCHYTDGKVEYRMPNTYYVSVPTLMKAIIIDDYPAQLLNKLFKKSVIISNGIVFQDKLDFYGEAFYFISFLRHSGKYRYEDKPLAHIQTERQWGTMEYSVDRYESFCHFYTAIKKTLAKKETEAVNRKIFETKVNFMEHSQLNTRCFNKRLETPLYLFWSTNWSLLRKIKYTTMYVFTKLEK